MFPSFYALSNSWFLLLLVPVIVFYFLKLKRSRLKISSLVLWQQVLQDNRVNSPFQKFKKHLLLLLQILLLVFIVLAAMQPFRKGTDSAENIPVLIDVSASMGSMGESGKTALEEVKDKVKEQIDGLNPGQKMALISFSSSARKLTGFTDNRKVLLEALDRITVEHVASEIENALRLIQALAQNTVIDRVRLFSDGNIPPRVGFGLPFFIDYQKTGEPLGNIGITALSAQRSGARTWSLLVKVSCSETAAGAGELELRQENTVIATEVLSFEAGSEQDLVFEIEGERASQITVTLISDRDDSLKADNTAFIELPAPRPLNVFVAPGLYPVQKALKSLPDINLFTAEVGEQADGVYDLSVSGRKEDLDINAGIRLFAGLIPSGLEGKVEIEAEADEVIDWVKHEPVLKHVSFHDLVILKKPVSEQGFNDTAFENLGFRVLVYGSEGPLFIKRDEPGIADYYMLFRPSDSTFPYRVGFPVMISNFVRLTRLRAGLAQIQAQKTGVLEDLGFSKGDRIGIRNPEGNTVHYGPLEGDSLAGAEARIAGMYSIEVNGKESGVTGVSLLSPGETLLKREKKLEFDEGLTVSSETPQVRTEKSMWPIMACIAFMLMIVEWWYFHKRPVVTAG